MYRSFPIRGRVTARRSLGRDAYWPYASPVNQTDYDGTEAAAAMVQGTVDGAYNLITGGLTDREQGIVAYNSTYGQAGPAMPPAQNEANYQFTKNYAAQNNPGGKYNPDAPAVPWKWLALGAAVLGLAGAGVYSAVKR
jgi:hypothetical protein